MRARAGDSPRTMTQKIFAAHVAGGLLPPEGNARAFRARIDHVVLTSMARTESLVRRLGAKRLAPELTVVYLPADGSRTGGPEDVEGLVARGFSVARPGAGFPSAVHLERFAGPARIVLTDDPRLSALGGAGSLVFIADEDMLVDALLTGSATLPALCTVHLSLSGRLRSFVSMTDVAFELLRTGISTCVREVAERTGLQVVLEIGGPSARFLGVPERAQIASMAMKLGAQGALFPADERVVSFLRDQRRSKAHRVLVDDALAPHAAEVSFDLGGTDPMLGDASGASRTVRELAKTKVAQVVLGGDVGAGYRELLTVAALLRSKRVPRTLDFLVAPPSRQVLEVLASSGALADLVATGARLVDPDPRILSGELHPPPSGDGVSLVSFVAKPSGPTNRYTTGPDTLALAVATGEINDPRAWKRAPRVAMPRALPTDDVLLVRGKARPAAR